MSIAPAIFVEFDARRFNLLWRGSCDGFEVTMVHRLCDSHGNTLTLITDTQACVFDGFTPLKWE
jgi:hypothetical protein